MGTADLVPGVSGGTIALVLGIYERLVSSIREGSSALGSLVKLDSGGVGNHLKRVEWAFLVSLLGGILLAVALLASFLEDQLEVVLDLVNSFPSAALRVHTPTGNRQRPDIASQEREGCRSTVGALRVRFVRGRVLTNRPRLQLAVLSAYSSYAVL